MNDEYDELLDYIVPEAAGAALSGGRRNDEPPPRQARRCAKPFDVWRSTADAESFGAPKSECAKTVLGFGLGGGYFVPVSFAAKDWNVTPRRIRALLAGGRLAGRLQENGYWEVRFPYSFTFGRRGPGLKRQRKQEKPRQKPELKAV